jgi:RecA/RadA recombinase
MDLNKLNEMLTKGTKEAYSEALASSTIGSIKEWIPSDFFDLNRIATGDLFKCIPRGKMVCLAAPEGTGKTIIILNLIKNAQAMGYQVLSAETEGAWDEAFVRKWGVHTKDLSYTYITTIEDFRVWIENVRAVVRDNPGQKFMITLDSLGALDPEKATQKKKDGGVYIDQGLLQRHIKTSFKAISSVCVRYDVPFVFANHLTANPNAGMYAQVEQMVGGKYQRHASWMIFYLTKSKKMNTSKTEVIGQLINIKSMKNRQYPPFQKAVIDLEYQKGPNFFAGMPTLATDLGYFEKAGSYFVVPNKLGEKIEWEIKKGKKQPVNGKKLYGTTCCTKGEEVFTPELMKEMNKKLKSKGYHSIDKELQEIFEAEESGDSSLMEENDV